MRTIPLRSTQEAKNKKVLEAQKIEDQQKIIDDNNNKQIAMDAEAAAAAAAAAAAPPPEEAPKQYPKRMTMLVVGIDNSGKSTFLKTICGDEDPKTAPTVGFNPVSLNLGGSNVSFYDIGGGAKIRDIWDSYYHDVHGVIYMVDSTSSDMKYAEACKVAKETLGHSYIQGKPLLFVCNKIDAAAARDVEEVKEDINVFEPPGGNVKCVGLNAHPMKTKDKQIDERIDPALEWLFDTVAADFENIKKRVESDCELEKQKQEEEKRIKDRRVMRKSISKAYGVDGEDVEDAFSQEDGEEFLAQEIGFMKAEELEEDGKEVAKLVGYQKLALMMVGGMFAPISSKKKRYTWAEIKSYVLAIRGEVGLN